MGQAGITGSEIIDGNTGTKISNLGKGALLLSKGKVRAYSRDGEELHVRGRQVIPDSIPPEESAQFTVSLGGWSGLGWGYTLDFSEI